jgi:transcriptional regulator with XRE-family HTH domain
LGNDFASCATPGSSRSKLAQVTGIHLGQISRYERGIILPSAETAVRLCRALRVSADVLLFGDRAKEARVEIENLRLLDSLSPPGRDGSRSAGDRHQAHRRSRRPTRSPKDRRQSAFLLTTAP